MKQFKKQMPVFREISCNQNEIFQLANFAFQCRDVGYVKISAVCTAAYVVLILTPGLQISAQDS